MNRRTIPLVAVAMVGLGCGGPGATSNDEVEVNAKLQTCPTISSLTAIESQASTRPPGNTSTIYASAAAPNAAKLKYRFSVTSGKGILSHQANGSNAIGTSSSVIFTCPAHPEVDTVRVVTTDESGATCPASLTTASTEVTCESAP